VLPEVFGVNAWIRSVCARLADAGFAAVALPLFARTAPNLELAYDTPSLEVGRSHRDAVTTANVLADLDRTIAWMASTAPFAGLPVGALGFCFGGLLAWWAATHPGVRTVVSAYGARVSEPAPGGGMPTLSALVQAQAHLLCLLGEDDPLIPREEQQQIRQALDEHQSLRLRRELVIYPGAGHGFLCDQRADFRSAAAEHAWCQIIDFLASTLGACSADL
jgi:carboxymethylenebutenolidase